MRRFLVQSDEKFPECQLLPSGGPSFFSFNSREANEDETKPFMLPTYIECLQVEPLKNGDSFTSELGDCLHLGKAPARLVSCLDGSSFFTLNLSYSSHCSEWGS